MKNGFGLFDTIKYRDYIKKPRQFTESFHMFILEVFPLKISIEPLYSAGTHE